MNFSITLTDTFSNHLKQLAKKYPSIKEDFKKLLSELSANPLSGISLGKNCFKVRMNIASKKKGKSGGARVITYLKIEDKKITLLDIYDKAEKDALSDKELRALLKKVE
jgi:mRNA-degrading endonuclease RelE of RelBE toxin-antitoxin system